MKLLKTITPIITLTGIATVVAPLTSCNNNNGQESEWTDVLHGEYQTKLTPRQLSQEMTLSQANVAYYNDIAEVALSKKTDLVADEILSTYSTVFKDGKDILDPFASFSTYKMKCNYDPIDHILQIDAKIVGEATQDYVTEQSLAVKKVDINVSLKVTNALNFYFAHIDSLPFKGTNLMKDNWVMGFFLGKTDSQKNFVEQNIEIKVDGTIIETSGETEVTDTWESKGVGDNFKGSPSYDADKKAYYIFYYYFMALTQPALFNSTEQFKDPYWNRIYFGTNYYQNAILPTHK